MGRYTGPSCKICRRNREKLFLKGERCFTAKCEIEKRNFPPGKRSPMMKKSSEYGRRLREKQKLRFFYGVSESKIRAYFEEASRQAGITGHNLLGIFESRLDNFVYRAKLASSRKEARQLIQHGHFRVNDKKLDVASALLKEGDILKVREKSLKIMEDRFKAAAENMPSWIQLDGKNKTVKLMEKPKRAEIDVPIEEQLIVEFYSR